MNKKHYVLVLLAFLLGLGFNRLAAQTKVLGGYVIEHDADLRRTNPGRTTGAA